MPISLILGGGIITPAVSVRYLHRKNLSASDNLGADSYKTTASEDLDRFIKSDMKQQEYQLCSLSMAQHSSISNLSDIFHKSCTRTDTNSIQQILTK